VDKHLKKRLYDLDHWLLGWLVRWLYPMYYRPRYNYRPNLLTLLQYALAQKVLRMNGKVAWPVHFTSKVLHAANIRKGILADPGDSPGVYINARNGIEMGSNVGIGPGTKILSANHDPDDYRRSTSHPPVRIGDHVWIGANVVILPGVTIGDNVIIGAGSVVTKSIPANVVAAGNPCRVLRAKAPYATDIYAIPLNRKFDRVE